MKQYKKSTKYYLMLFGASVVIMGGYTIYKYFSGSLATEDLWNLVAIPVIFTGVYWGGDILLQKIANRRKKVNYEGLFLDAVGARMRESNEFLIEEFRHLQNNIRFQDSLKIAYFISQNGESDNFNLGRLEHKFEKRTLEYKAMGYVISFLKEKLAEKSK